MPGPLSPYQALDTPVLLIDRDILMRNIADMQQRADSFGVWLRPHTKTHKCPDIARMQLAAGASGIAVAKPGEAEVMAEAGISDIFIANEVVGVQKLERLRALGERIDLSFGADSLEALLQIEKVFSRSSRPARVLIEIETGERRSGVVKPAQFDALIDFLEKAQHIIFEGVFSHEGFTYQAASRQECLAQFEASQQRTLDFARRAAARGLPCRTVSVGATPTAWLAQRLLPGVTELRPGTYALMDAAQGNALGSHERCAATVLTTIISKPTPERLIGDVGAKGLTAQTRPAGICKTNGFGIVKGTDVHPYAVYDEHLILYSAELHDALQIGDKIEIIPNHICPVCNLYDQVLLVADGKVLQTLSIACRGRLQ